MRVLLTGATTPLGHAIAKRLVRDERVDRLVSVGVEPDSEVFPGLMSAGCRYVRVDLTRSRNVRDLMGTVVLDEGITAIVHAAMHRGAHAEGSGARRLNVAATRTLIHLAEQYPSVRRFVFRSSGQLYRIGSTTPTIIREDVELDLSPDAPQWVRDRVEADLLVCARMNTDRLGIAVLRCAEILVGGNGSQLHDYLSSRVCIRPLGFDPMVNVLSLDDAARAFILALHSDVSGVFNVPGADLLPLSKLIRSFGRLDVVAPGPLLGPLYKARRWVKRTDFRWDLNARRFHFGHVLDGHLASERLGYEPHHRSVGL